MFGQGLHQIRRARALSLLALALAAGCGDGPVESAPQTAEVARVEVSPGTHTLRSGEVYHFTASPRAANGTALQERVEWLTSDERVAGVDVNGTVSARSPGSVVITARSGGRMGSAALTVEAAPAAVASVEITPASPLTVGVGGTRQLAALVRAADGSVIAGRAVEWLSSDTLVARVSPAGLAEGRAEGQAVISARVEGRTAQASLVVAFSQSPNVPVGSVEVQAPKGRVEPGESMQLVAIVRAPSGPALERAVEWSSDNPAVATVGADGRVTGHATGWARIRASAGGKQGYLEVQVARWTTQELLAMDGRALPGSFTTYAPGGDGRTI
ncbi:MAG: Ig-like domain-containing protein, partial [Gemmatimonadetes bacterium]|nr:Ig-like domain-containing protein [Gemmatimonadota bacterium]